VILIATIMSVLILEILNTSIESIVDLVVKKEFSSLAKISKDTSAGAVLLASLILLLLLYIFLFLKLSCYLNLYKYVSCY